MLGILKRLRHISIHNHYLSQAMWRLQATLHMIFVFQTADYYIYRADVFQDISWLTSLFRDSMRVFFKSHKVVRSPNEASPAILGKWFPFYMACKCQSIRGCKCHCLAWASLHPPSRPTPQSHCRTNKGLWGFTISSET